MSETVTVTQDVTIDDVICAVHGHGSVLFKAETDRYGAIVITIDPCDGCVRDAKQEGSDA